MTRWPLLRTDRWRLANRLAFCMVVVAASAIALLFFDINRANRAEIEALQVSSLQGTTRELARGLDTLVRGELGRVGNLARSRSVVEFMTVRPNQRSALFTPTLTDFSNFIASSPFYRAVLLLDHHGEVMLSTQGSYVGQSFADSAFFHQAIGGQMVMSDPGISQLDRQPVIWLASPVFHPNLFGEDAPANLPGGVVTVALSPEWLWDYVDRQTVGRAGYAMLVDSFGIRLAHGGDRRMIFRALAPLPPDTLAALRAEGRFGPLTMIADTGSTALLDYLRADPLPPLLIARPAPTEGLVYYSGARMQTRAWTVVAMLSEAEILAPANRVTIRGLAATVIVSLLLGVSVWWLTQQIVRAVPQLAQAATQIARGDLATPVTVRGSSELRTLAENFEIMRQRLRTSHEELSMWAGTLETRVARRSQELAALSEVIAFASRNQSRGDLLSTALHQALRVMKAEMGGIWLADQGGVLHLVAREGFNPALQAPLVTFGPGEGLLGQVQMQGVPVAVEDISQAPKLARTIVRDEELHAFAAVPLRIHGRTLGVMALLSRSTTGFSPETVALAASIGQQIALTLDNIALMEQVQSQARAVASLQERERIAGDIHDSLAQTLGYLYLQTDQLVNDLDRQSVEETGTRLSQMQAILAQAAGDVRQFIARLHETPPPPTCLGRRLREELTPLAEQLAIQLSLACAPEDDLTVPADTGTELSRIACEATRNAQRHGGATVVSVRVERHGEEAHLVICDNGAGFDPERPPDDGRSHFGLSVMRARSARIGGTLEIASSPGQGATIRVRWPPPALPPCPEESL